MTHPSAFRQFAIVSFSLALLGLAPIAALAQQAALAAGSSLPDWRAADVCKRDSVTSQCDLFESRAAKTISGSWAFIPEDVRARCLGESARPEAQSWRLLAGCIETAMSRSTDRRAVLTAHTPTEPVPPRKVTPPPVLEAKPEVPAVDTTPAASAPAASTPTPAVPEPAPAVKN